MSASTEANSVSCEFLQIGLVFSRLHPNAVLSGNLIKIPGISQETCRSIQRLVLRGELDWARHLKVSIDLGPSAQIKVLWCFGCNQLQNAIGNT